VEDEPSHDRAEALARKVREQAGTVAGLASCHVQRLPGRLKGRHPIGRSEHAAGCAGDQPHLIRKTVQVLFEGRQHGRAPHGRPQAAAIRGDQDERTRASAQRRPGTQDRAVL
jgi:hypothetical protein